MKNWIKTSCILAFSSLACPVFAQTNVFAQESTAMYAGPGYNYPSIDQVYQGQNLQLYGCLQDLSWCDVSNMNDRGWIIGDALGMQYGGQTVYLESNPDFFNPPILFFDIGAYWGLHYHNRPWYHDWHRYPPPPPPRPRVWPGRPYYPHGNDRDWHNREGQNSGRASQSWSPRPVNPPFRPLRASPVQNNMSNHINPNPVRSNEQTRSQQVRPQNQPHSSPHQQGNHKQDDHHPNDHDH